MRKNPNVYFHIEEAHRLCQDAQKILMRGDPCDMNLAAVIRVAQRAAVLENMNQYKEETQRDRVSESLDQAWELNRGN